MNITEEYLIEEYVNKERSFKDIADELNTYPNAVRRKAIKFRIQPRDKSGAQKSALKSNRHKHPTKGTKRTDEVKVAISEGVSKSWQNLTDAARDKRVEQSRDSWEALSDNKRNEIQGKAIKAIRRTAKDGSKLEKFIRDSLINAGFLIEFHKKGILANQQLEVDLFLPSNNIAIEIDGPSHFKDIWGNGSLSRVQKADNEKNGLLLLYKIHVIRVKQLRRNLSDKNLRDTAIAVLNTVKELSSTVSQPDIHNIEVK